MLNSRKTNFSGLIRIAANVFMIRAGGGGRKSKVRQEKLIVKNAKLNEERQQVASDRAKDKADRRAQAEDGENGMHPSRRRRIQ